MINFVDAALATAIAVTPVEKTIPSNDVLWEMRYACHREYVRAPEYPTRKEINICVENSIREYNLRKQLQE